MDRGAKKKAPTGGAKSHSADPIRGQKGHDGDLERVQARPADYPQARTTTRT